jgi:NAD(P)-dependent dehydrogenase (short-subunit alcohol dehydrogenase family)
MSNKLCVVTGVGKGNGRSIAGRFAREGYRVAMLARTRQALDRSEAVEMAQAYRDAGATCLVHTQAYDSPAQYRDLVAAVCEIIQPAVR